MSVCATDRRRHAWLAALALSSAASLTGCLTQDYVRGLGHHAAKGAMGAVGDGIPAIEEPLRQTLRRALVEDDTLRRAAKDMTESAVKTLEAGLASPEMRRQIDDLVVRAMESLARNGDEAVRRLVQGAEPEVKEALRRLIASVESDLRETIVKVAADGIDKMTVRLRERIEREVTPATERLAKRTGEQLITSLVAGLEGPLQKRLLEAGQGMSTLLIKGVALGLNEPSNQESFGSLTQVMSLQAVRGARQGMSGATSTIPIVTVGGIDPVKEGWAATLARPGGKRHRLFDWRCHRLGGRREMARASQGSQAGPPARRRPLRRERGRPCSRPEGPGGSGTIPRPPARPAARAGPRRPFGSGCHGRRGGAGALVVWTTPMLHVHQPAIVDLAVKHRLPAIAFFADFAEMGGLMAYGPNLIALFRRTAGYTDRILKGANPAEMPVERPARPELTLNIKTAKVLRLTLPPALILRADRVIE